CDAHRAGSVTGETWSGLEERAALYASDGLAPCTPVATPTGWRRAEALRPGDRVLTFDDGPMPIRAIRHAAGGGDPGDWSIGDWPRAQWPRAHWPLAVPAGALGNRWPVTLLPDQPVLVEAEAADALFDDPFALVPARALNGWRQIAPVPPPHGLRPIGLVFDAAQVIYAGSALLLHCAGEEGPLPLLPTHPPRYVPLPLGAARILTSCMIAEDAGAALAAAPALP
ncbi:MAG: Hint domain-containing protein, partial [Gemmobacter sp.]